MMIVEDSNHPLANQLPNDYGKNDFPIIIQEKDFVFNGNTATDIKATEQPGNGRFTVVNGVAGGVMHVPKQMVRLRFLNGSPRKMYGISLSTERDNPTSFKTIYQVATGGGYLQQVRFIDSTLLSVGDRRDFVVDFTTYADGDTVYLINNYLPTDALYLNGMPAPTSRMPASADRAIMAFVVDQSINPAQPVFAIPVGLDPTYALAPGDVFRTRTKRLMGGSGQQWTINGDTMNMMVINDTVLVNTKERWIIKNETNHAHPFHIHKVQFQVVEYTGKLGFSDDSTTTYTFSNLPDELVGWKDVQLVRAGATMTFEARFDSFPSPAISPMEGFMYHCHILTHEDNSMMGQFVVVDSLAYYTNTNKISITKSLFVFPNPAGDMISFDAADINDKGTLRIYDITGRMLREENNMFLSGRSSINVSDLPRGMIFVEFRTEKERYLQKVLLH
ncbi:MAG: multicopper oxidase domain-containing protein [Saprospiraceae bacterium]